MALDLPTVIRDVARGSSCTSTRTSPEEGIKLHRFAGILPEQLLTVAGRNREAVVATDQRMVIRCFGDDLASFVHDISHVPSQKEKAARRRLFNSDLMIVDQAAINTAFDFRR